MIDGQLVDLSDVEAAEMFPPVLQTTQPLAQVSVISRRQFFQQIAVAGLITQAEALAAAGSGSIPNAMQLVIDAMPTEERFGVSMLIVTAAEFEIDNPFVSVFAAGQTPPLSKSQVGDLWRAAALL